MRDCWASDAVADVSWPEFLPRCAFDWMPREVIERYGTMQHCVFDHNYVEFPPEQKRFILAELGSRGYACRRADALVSLACGSLAAGFTANRLERLLTALGHRLPSLPSTKVNTFKLESETWTVN
jgi:DNA-directed RNA polymerase subunit N (RpoN/RPB10)